MAKAAFMITQYATLIELVAQLLVSIHRFSVIAFPMSQKSVSDYGIGHCFMFGRILNRVRPVCSTLFFFLSC